RPSASLFGWLWRRRTCSGGGCVARFGHLDRRTADRLKAGNGSLRQRVDLAVDPGLLGPPPFATRRGNREPPAAAREGTEAGGSGPWRVSRRPIGTGGGTPAIRNANRPRWPAPAQRALRPG